MINSHILVHFAQLKNIGRSVIINVIFLALIFQRRFYYDIMNNDSMKSVGKPIFLTLTT